MRCLTKKAKTLPCWVANNCVATFGMQFLPACIFVSADISALAKSPTCRSYTMHFPLCWFAFPFRILRQKLLSILCFPWGLPRRWVPFCPLSCVSLRMLYCRSKMPWTTKLKLKPRLRRHGGYKLKTIISTMPQVSNASPKADFQVNFSFKTTAENSIVSSMESLPMAFTAMGFAPSQFSA